MVSYWKSWVDKYPIISIEDGMAEDDWDGWKRMTDVMGKKIQLVGDDIFVTNMERLSEGFKRGVANSILIKLNQIGTLTETVNCVEMAHKMVIRRSSATGQAKRKIPLSLTSPWH